MVTQDCYFVIHADERMRRADRYAKPSINPSVILFRYYMPGFGATGLLPPMAAFSTK
jgi:hypothetical protein